MGSTIHLPHATAATRSRATDARFQKVLVVDDLPEIGQFFRGLARRIGDPRVQIITETDSTRAVDMVSSTEFDLVVSDYRMGSADGIDVLQAARAFNPTGFRVLMTGYTEIPSDLKRIEGALVDAYVQKPLRSDFTLQLIRAYLDQDPVTIAANRAHARFLEQDARDAEDPLSGWV